MNGREESFPLAEGSVPAAHSARVGAHVWCCAFRRFAFPPPQRGPLPPVPVRQPCCCDPSLLGAQLGFALLRVMEERSGAACQACSVEENAL